MTEPIDSHRPSWWESVDWGCCGLLALVALLLLGPSVALVLKAFAEWIARH